MKPIHFPLALSLALTPVLATAQEEAGTPAPAASAASQPRQENDPTLGLLESLPKEQQDKVKKAISEASTFVGGIRLQEALQRLGEAEVIAPDLFMVHNLKGAVFTKMRMFDEARKSFKKAQSLHPKSFHPKFNLAEIEFVEAADKARAGDDAGAAAQFASAQKMFEALIADGGDVATQRLMEFKVVISLLKQGKVEEAEKAVKAFSYIDDEPVYYLGHAAVAFHKGDKEEAQGWINSANRIYPPQQVTIYMDSFIEVGWVETLAL
jgi:tetratricopeptide (TPR) repeat protein